MEISVAETIRDSRSKEKNEPRTEPEEIQRAVKRPRSKTLGYYHRKSSRELHMVKVSGILGQRAVTLIDPSPLLSCQTRFLS
jgi:hypothetical protein